MNVVLNDGMLSIIVIIVGVNGNMQEIATQKETFQKEKNLTYRKREECGLSTI